MGFGDLVALGMRCKLQGGALRNEKSAREGLRRYREENGRGAGRVMRASKASEPVLDMQKQGPLPLLVEFH